MNQKEKTLNNGVKIPRVGLGVYKATDGAETVSAVKHAIDAGYRLIDTAMFYDNEEGVGQGIRESGINREDIFITTKVWNDDIRGGNTRQAFEKSMEKLKLDYLDMYLLHWPVEGYVEAWKVLEELYHEKRIRAIGVSNFHQKHLEEIFKVSNVVPVLDQIECHPYLSQKPLRDYLAERDIAAQAWRPLGGAGGNIIGDAVIAELAQRYGKSPAQIILRWNLQSDILTIPKSVNKERIEGNIDIFDFELTKEDMEKINHLNRNQRLGEDPDKFDF